MNLANKLTVIRIFLVPIFLIFIAVQGIPYGTFIATFIFILASLTDKLDGYIARSRNQITNFGKVYGPPCRQAACNISFNIFGRATNGT